MGLTAKKLRIKNRLSRNVTFKERIGNHNWKLKSFDQRSPDYYKIAIFPSH